MDAVAGEPVPNAEQRRDRVALLDRRLAEMKLLREGVELRERGLFVDVAELRRDREREPVERRVVGGREALEPQSSPFSIVAFVGACATFSRSVSPRRFFGTSPPAERPLLLNIA